MTKKVRGIPNDTELLARVVFREPDGQFASFDEWVNKALSWIGGTNSLCVDAANRVCYMGKQFMEARDDGTFPVRFYFNAGYQTPAEQRRSAAIAKRARFQRGFA